MCISLKDKCLHTPMDLHTKLYIHVYIYMFSFYTYAYTPAHMTSFTPAGIHLGLFFVCLVSEHGTYILKFNETRGVSLDVELLHFGFDCFAIIL